MRSSPLHLIMTAGLLVSCGEVTPSQPDATTGVTDAAGTADARALDAEPDAAPGPGALEVTPAIMDFGAIELAASNAVAFTLSTTGPGPLSSPTVTTSGGAAFTVIATTCAGPLLPASPCTVTVRFAPTVAGGHTGTLHVTAGTAAADVQLIGSGAAALTITRVGTGTGTVAGGDILCGPTCTASPTTASVVLTSTAAAGSRFAGWGGAASACGSSPTCAVAIDAGTVSVTADFVDLPSLRVLVDDPPQTAGHVTFGVEDCDLDCAYEFAAPTTVTLRAVDGQSRCATFSHWELGCTGAQSTCSFTLTADTTVRAVFSHRAGCVLP